MENHHLKVQLDSNRSHRMLSIDGGGIRGVIALEVLSKIERDLRVLTGKDDLVLADWFDFIGGTSTGAIVATGLSMGLEVDDLMSLYTERGKTMFKRARFLERLWYNRYSHQELEDIFKSTFGAKTTLGTDRLKTLLMVVLRNATTDSPWPLTNNPRAKYNQPDCGEANNLNLPLWQVVRGSTAAPTFYRPEKINLGEDDFTFVDGALTPYNNPAFMMFLNATLPQYNLNWKASEEDLLLISVGTGLHPDSAPDLDPHKMNLLYVAKSAPKALIYANIVEQDKMCRLLGNCLVGDELDSEIEDMIGTPNPAGDNAFTYARYNVDLTRKALEKIGCADLADLPLELLDAVDLIGPLRRVGRAIAESKVSIEHFAKHCPFRAEG